MKPSDIIQRIIRHDQNNAVKTAAFIPGQIVSGKIVKLFPNQTAEVQIGSHKAIAQLEIPLSANIRYWFKVEPGEGMLRLKVMESADRPGAEAPAESLLRQLGMQLSRENKMLIQFFLREQLPITGETLKMASEWIKESRSAEDGLRTVKELFIRQLPFSKDVFSAISSVLHGDSLSSLMGELLDELKGGGLSTKGQQIYSLLGDLTKPSREKWGQQAIYRLFSEWLNTKNQASSHTAFQLLKVLGLMPGETAEDAALQQLMEVSIQNKPISHVLTEIMKANDSGNRQEFILNLAKLNGFIAQRSESSGLSQTLEILFNDIRNGKNSFPAEKNLLNTFFKSVLSHTLNDDLDQLLSDAYGIKQAAVQAGRLLAGEKPLAAAALNLREKTMMEELKNSLQTEVNLTYDQRNIHSELKRIIRTLGLSYEHDFINLLKHSDEGASKKLDTLKPLLMGFINEETSHIAKDAAERLLHKLTGFQALSQESGPLQHYIFQLPVSLWGKISDLTMQWSGRKTEEGKIDPSHCRVIFYLNLEHLNETIVDLQVQNRIIKISVINEHKEIKDLTAPFAAELKENLLKLNYKLSSVSVQKPESAGDSPIGKDTMTSIVQSNQFSGVDIRI
ncbi:MULTISPECIES: hypothetical protein [Cytobacillus]|uniref:Flagellar hook-length control protein FliK n=2 Tax=Cytobacillus TaxID=2675230 RepID=A0ABX3CWQ7_9BACI|nr:MULTISPECIES: hypothetical protein [Cytobacillus]EFV79425.1 hypothetical protein HMPREF1013_00341 [Bacillus sp. 2_A_57_CT2]MBY0157423.1 hypothetical protein [Cytobacillus firmus]MBU8729323.1 hypothetical protein [Cytobacillus oceanisediminis]MCM3242861.1 hypothetical protein [Cytobacillus oceanisediminis]MCM3528012.1 hypothetical protein [Cytobacillus oceanisediminis]